MWANENDYYFTDNTPTTTSFKQAVKGVLKAHDIGKAVNFERYLDQKQIFDNPQATSLPFECEDQIKSGASGNW